jgi:pimeloyl-ACP methyl ester carboxylesterase
MWLGLTILLLAGLALVLAAGAAAVAYRLAHPPRRTAGTNLARGLPTDPEEAGFPYETDRVELPHGPAIELWRVSGGDPSGPTLVLLHAWGESRYGLLAWLPVLGPLARRLVLFDARAHGDSPARRFTGGRDEATDLAAVVEHLRHTDPDADTAAAGPIVLVGMSIGAVIAIREAGRLEVAGVIADSAYDDAVAVTRRTVRSTGLPGLPLAWPACAYLALRHGRRTWRPTHRDAAALTRPLLLLHGRADRLAPPAEAERIAAAAPRAELAWFDHADHLALIDRAPDRYRRLVAAWLERHRRGGA